MRLVDNVGSGLAGDTADKPDPDKPDPFEKKQICSFKLVNNGLLNAALFY